MRGRSAQVRASQHLSPDCRSRDAGVTRRVPQRPQTRHARLPRRHPAPAGRPGPLRRDRRATRLRASGAGVRLRLATSPGAPLLHLDAPETPRVLDRLAHLFQVANQPIRGRLAVDWRNRNIGDHAEKAVARQRGTPAIRGVHHLTGRLRDLPAPGLVARHLTPAGAQHHALSGCEHLVCNIDILGQGRTRGAVLPSRGPLPCCWATRQTENDRSN